MFPAIAAALGAAYTLGGHFPDAMPLLTSALEQTMTTELGCYQAIFGYQVLGHLSRGEAQALAVRALELARTHQEPGHQAYALHLLGEIAVHREPAEVEPADIYYHQACTLAEELNMRPLQAHCHHGLGTLYAATGHGDKPAPRYPRPLRCTHRWT